MPLKRFIDTPCYRKQYIHANRRLCSQSCPDKLTPIAPALFLFPLVRSRWRRLFSQHSPEACCCRRLCPTATPFHFLSRLSRAGSASCGWFLFLCVYHFRSSSDASPEGGRPLSSPLSNDFWVPRRERRYLRNKANFHFATIVFSESLQRAQDSDTYALISAWNASSIGRTYLKAQKKLSVYWPNDNHRKLKWYQRQAASLASYSAS